MRSSSVFLWRVFLVALLMFGLAQGCRTVREIRAQLLGPGLQRGESSHDLNERSTISQPSVDKD